MRFTRSTGIRSVGAFRNTGARRRKASLVAALTTGALVLAACGSATVEDEAPETLSKSSTQTTKSTAASSTTSPGAGKDDKDGKDGKKSSEGSTTAKSGSGQNNAEPAPQTAGGRDRGAQEIDEIPETNPFEGENAAFLDDVRALGVDVAGVEGQVVSAGYLVCDEQTAILQAVAGQLIGQHRTDREFEDLVDKLTESARGRFC